MISDDSKVESLIETLKENKSLYKKIISTLLSLGSLTIINEKSKHKRLTKHKDS